MAQKVNAGTEQPHGAGHQKVFPPLDPQFYASQLIWLALTFGALYVLLSRVALPRIREVIEERQSRIRRDLDEAERLKSETDKALKAYEKAIADARAEAQVTTRANRDAITAETDREKAAREAELAQMLSAAEARISANKAKAMASVSEIAMETAGAVVERLVGRKPSPDQIKKALAPAAGE